MIVTDIVMYLALGILGLVFGSFITALTYRSVRSISIAHGRSKCPKCKAPIAWHDNIPLLSYILLGGKCRKCHAPISRRYPLIEVATALTFIGTYVLVQPPYSVEWLAGLKVLALPYVLVMAVLLISICVTDLEEKIIPDTLVFSGVIITFFALLLSDYDGLYRQLLSGSGAAIFFLALWGATKGKGMGMGDIKLAFLVGLIFGARLTLVWGFVAFISGAAIGLVLIGLRKTKFGREIPFGPFMVGAAALCLIGGNKLAALLVPFM